MKVKDRLLRNEHFLQNKLPVINVEKEVEKHADLKQKLHSYNSQPSLPMIYRKIPHNNPLSALELLDKEEYTKIFTLRKYKESKGSIVKSPRRQIFPKFTSSIGLK